MLITDALAQVVSPVGTAPSAALKGIDFAGKTGSAQTISNDLKKRLGAEGKHFKDNGWFVGVTPRRNPEIVVAVLLEEGEHGYYAARAAAQVIKAYVEKQRTRETQVAKANGAAGKQQAEVAAVWHDGDAKQPDKMQAGRFTVSTDGKTKPVTAAPGVEEEDRPKPAAKLEATESHDEMAHPENQIPAPEPPKPPSVQPDEQQDQKKPVVKPPVAPAAAAVSPGATMSRYISFRDFDWVLLVLVLLICALGVVEIYSATLSTKFVGVHIKQVYWILGGVALMFVVSFFNYQALLERVPLLYLISIASLVAVAVFGKKYLGARRWVQIGSFHFQPSEWVKLVLILAMAKYFADSKPECTTQDIVKAGALVGVPMLMVLAQPDLGTALTYLPDCHHGPVSRRDESQTRAGHPVIGRVAGAGGMACAEALSARPADQLHGA